MNFQFKGYKPKVILFLNNFFTIILNIVIMIFILIIPFIKTQNVKKLIKKSNRNKCWEITLKNYITTRATGCQCPRRC